MSTGFLIDGSISFEPANYKITINGKEVRLSQKECQVLEILCVNCNVVIERNLLIEPIWGNSASGDIGLNKAILLLRRKFESHDKPGLINTVPRVGYSLSASVTEKIYAEDDVNPDTPFAQELKEIDSKVTNKKNTNIKKRKKLLYLAALSFTATITVITGLILSSSNEVPEITAQYKTSSGTIYTTSKANKELSLVKTNEYISKEKNLSFRALISNEILSFILYENKNPIKQMILLFDNNKERGVQLSCMDNYLYKNIKTLDEPTSGLISGMMYSTKKFYSFCDDNVARELAILYTKGTKLAHGSEQDHMMLQDFLLRTPDGEEIFHIKRYVNHLGFGTDNMRIVQKSIMSDNINMNLIHTNELYSGLLSELTKDRVIHTRIESQLYVSDIFDGMLFYSKDYH